MDTMVINNREEFAQWAIERANAIIVEQGSARARLGTNGSGEDTDYEPPEEVRATRIDVWILWIISGEGSDEQNPITHRRS